MIELFSWFTLVFIAVCLTSIATSLEKLAKDSAWRREREQREDSRMRWPQ